ncbi:DUF551 domain-containing protein [Klebsiella quasipneumoniae]
MPPAQPVADSEPVAVIDLANLDYLLSGADADVWPPEREEMGDVLLYRHAQPAPDGEQLAIENFRSAMEGVGHIRRTLEETFGGLHGTHVEPDVLAECKAICDAIYAAYRHAQPAPVVPNGLRLALSNAGIAAPESDEMLAATCEKHIQALVTWVRDRKPFQSAPVVMDDRKLRSLFDSWFASDCSFDLSPEASEEDNIAWRESYWYVWQRCRAAMLQAGNSPVIPDGYVMVPKEMTDEIGEAIAMQANCCGGIALDIYDAMLAAAPHDIPALNSLQSVDSVADRWIPVSEQMPDDDDFVYIWPRPDFGVELHVGQYCECSPKGDGWYAQVYEQNYGIEWHPITVTHWMPLPAGPKEDINALIPLVSRNEQEVK